MKALLLLSVLISLSSPALARIGETREQCEARYGKPVRNKEEEQTVHYEKAGYHIVCEFYEGKCEDISFNHVAQEGEGKPLPLSDNEVKVLMESNSGGIPWSLTIKEADGFEAWQWNELEAYFNERPVRYLFIATKASAARRRAKDAAEDEKARRNLKNP
ncbi:hypothetical protein [Brevifollis gellanilyticus]|uniref:Uncharacterized protein n=1 Tax=Brevifollis gellanilyticus TaxID=748831 RepID=A0A512MI44_9BACT|nr:hypothetical protein [Brevifollis gellanilyticus]GEP46400.1 hypothetical protein BGE01nite_56910 [Brevifollis gellanilyticus]